MNLYHDRARNLLVYPHNARIEQYVPEAKRVNGAYLAVPNTLRNVQLLRILDMPVPGIMEASGYDWPIEKGRKPLEHQKLMAEFMVSHPRCFNLSDMGCVGGETLIDTSEGKISIERLAAADKRFNVRCLTNAGPKFVNVAPPFQKGFAPLYRVTFRSGRSIVVTKRHVFLTCRGWTSCEHLQIGESLPVFDAYPQESTWEFSLLALPLGERRSLQIVEDYFSYLRILSCDGQPLSVADIDPTSIPSLADALKRNRFAWQMDVQDNECTHSGPSSAGPFSSHRCGGRIDQGETGGFLSEYATKLTDSRYRISARYRLFPNRVRVTGEDQELQLCIPVNEALASPFDTVTHIA